MSRGGKEGNNALTKDLQNVDKEDHMTYAMKNNVTKATLDLLVGQGVGSVSFTQDSSLYYLLKVGSIFANLPMGI